MNQIKQKIKIMAVLIDLIESKMEYFDLLIDKDNDKGHRLSNEILRLEVDLLQRFNELQKIKL